MTALWTSTEIIAGHADGVLRFKVAALLPDDGEDARVESLGLSLSPAEAMRLGQAFIVAATVTTPVWISDPELPGGGIDHYQSVQMPDAEELRIAVARGMQAGDAVDNPGISVVELDAFRRLTRGLDDTPDGTA